MGRIYVVNEFIVLFLIINPVENPGKVITQGGNEHKLL
jgi:hypothetical protein